MPPRRPRRSPRPPWDGVGWGAERGPGSSRARVWPTRGAVRVPGSSYILTPRNQTVASARIIYHQNFRERLNFLSRILGVIFDLRDALSIATLGVAIGYVIYRRVV